MCNVYRDDLKGYYFIPEHTKDMHYLSDTFSGAALKLEETVDKHLTQGHYQYRVIFSHGVLANGRLGVGSIDYSYDMLDFLGAYAEEC